MRAVLVGAALVGAVAIVWMSRRGDDPVAPAAPAASAAAASGADRGSAGSVRGASDSPSDPSGDSRLPRLPPRPAGPAGAPAGPGELPLAERPLFDDSDAEPRDPAWATATETAIRERVDALLADRDQPTVPQLECRETMCRLLVTSPDDGALRRFVADLNSERGFVGVADMLAFEEVDRRQAPDGTSYQAVRVMLVYRR